jgi:RNA polymerase sigma-70 factor (ECF subfamily)
MTRGALDAGLRRYQPASTPVGDAVGANDNLFASGHLSSAELFRQFAPFVASFLLRIGVQRADLDDLIQDVFLVAHRNGGYTVGPAKPTTYLAAIAIRAASSHRRKRRTRSFVQFNSSVVNIAPDQEINPESHIDKKRKLQILQRALDKMDDDKRSIFVLAELYGETVVSLANGLGINVDTAYNRLRVARKIFRGAAKSLWIPPTRCVDENSLETY